MLSLSYRSCGACRTGNYGDGDVCLVVVDAMRPLGKKTRHVFDDWTFGFDCMTPPLPGPSFSQRVVFKLGNCLRLICYSQVLGPRIPKVAYQGNIHSTSSRPQFMPKAFCMYANRLLVIGFSGDVKTPPKLKCPVDIALRQIPPCSRVFHIHQLSTHLLVTMKTDPIESFKASLKS